MKRRRPSNGMTGEERSHCQCQNGDTPRPALPMLKSSQENILHDRVSHHQLSGLFYQHVIADCCLRRKCANERQRTTICLLIKRTKHPTEMLVMATFTCGSYSNINPALPHVTGVLDLFVTRRVKRFPGPEGRRISIC